MSMPEHALRGRLAAASVATVALALAAPPARAQDGPGLGVEATSEQVAAWSLTVLPDGTGLPPGSGTARAGEAIYAQKCLACHGAEPIRLEIRRSSGAATEKVFAKPCVLIGRDTRADLPLVNPDVAPRALYLQLIGGRVFAARVADTPVKMADGRAWEAGWVQPTDEFEFGWVKVRVVNPDQRAPATPPETRLEQLGETFLKEMKTAQLERVNSPGYFAAIDRAQAAYVDMILETQSRIEPRVSWFERKCAGPFAGWQSLTPLTADRTPPRPRKAAAP